MCALYEKKIKKELMNQKMKDVLFSSMFFLCFKNYGYIIILMCFDNLIKCIRSLLYSVGFMISTHVYLYNNFFNDVSIHLSKEKKPKHLKLTNS
jgi:hypothetical protein